MCDISEGHWRERHIAAYRRTVVYEQSFCLFISGGTRLKNESNQRRRNKLISIKRILVK